jgi:uncharacterized protein (DUF302 family)
MRKGGLMKKAYLTLLLLSITTLGCAGDGLITLKSKYSVKETTKLLVQSLENKGMTVFDTIDHKKGAESVSKKLRPTTVVIFGNPKIGTPLMHCSQTIAIDLPQKALIWQDANKQVWYTYNNPQYLAKRHNLQGCDEILNKVTNALANFAKAATN